MSVESYLYDDLYTLEDSHWWHRAKRQYVLRLIRKYNHAHRPAIMDIGCGTGKNVEVFTAIGQAGGIDMSPTAVAYCRKRHLKHVRVGRAEKTGLHMQSADVVTMLDVLEHVDERVALREIHRILKPGGTLIVSVPAHTWLWSTWDVVLHHKRRYQKKRLTTILRANGFSVSYISYAYAFLVIPALVIRFIKSRFIRGTYESDFRLSSPIVNTILQAVSEAEQWLALRGIPVVTGTSLFCVATSSV